MNGNRILHLTSQTIMFPSTEPVVRMFPFSIDHLTDETCSFRHLKLCDESPTLKRKNAVDNKLKLGISRKVPKLLSLNSQNKLQQKLPESSIQYEIIHFERTGCFTASVQIVVLATNQQTK